MEEITVHQQGEASINNTQYLSLESTNDATAFITFTLEPNQTEEVIFVVLGAPASMTGFDGLHTIKATPQPTPLIFQGNLESHTITVVNISQPDQTLHMRVAPF